MLRVHAAAKNRTSIARQLAKAAGYQDYRGFNLQYGLLAKRIGKGEDPRGQISDFDNWEIAGRGPQAIF